MKEIDARQVERLARIGCTYSEIGAVVGCDKSTVSRRFATEIAKGHERLRRSIRRWQIKAAKAGNIAMLIWLGKQWLGQADKQEVEVDLELRALFQGVSMLRTEFQKDPQYLEYLRYRAGNGNGDSRAAGQSDLPQLADGTPPGDGRRGPDGNGDGA